MASAIVSTKRRAGAAGLLVNDDEGVGEFSCRREFPSSDTIIEDLQLRVLLGRQGFRTQQSNIKIY
jgi:hypothetical protein